MFRGKRNIDINVKMSLYKKIYGVKLNIYIYGTPFENICHTL